MRYVLRLALPDRPGSLSAVAAAIARLEADIAALEVIERQGDLAVDDLCVETAADPGALRRGLEALPGVVVEAVREVRVFRDTDAAMELAADLVDEGGGAVVRLVEGLPAALWASWCVALTRGVAGPEILAVSSGAPSLDGIEAPWLPLDEPRRLGPAEWMPPAWRERTERGELALAVAPLSGRMAAVLLARAPGPRFRSSELRQLALLGHLAVVSEVRGTQRRPVARVGVSPLAVPE